MSSCTSDAQCSSSSDAAAASATAGASSPQAAATASTSRGRAREPGVMTAWRTARPSRGGPSSDAEFGRFKALLEVAARPRCLQGLLDALSTKIDTRFPRR
jgi:hypothetical protein